MLANIIGFIYRPIPPSFPEFVLTVRHPSQPRDQGELVGDFTVLNLDLIDYLK